MSFKRRCVLTGCQWRRRPAAPSWIASGWKFTLYHVMDAKGCIVAPQQTIRSKCRYGSRDDILGHIGATSTFAPDRDQIANVASREVLTRLRPIYVVCRPFSP